MGLVEIVARCSASSFWVVLHHISPGRFAGRWRYTYPNTRDAGEQQSSSARAIVDAASDMLLPIGWAPVP